MNRRQTHGGQGEIESLSDYIWSRRIDDWVAQLVALAIAEVMRCQGRCEVPTSYLAGMTGLSVRSVQSKVRDLEARGIIRRYSTPGNINRIRIVVRA